MEVLVEWFWILADALPYEAIVAIGICGWLVLTTDTGE